MPDPSPSVPSSPSAPAPAPAPAAPSAPVIKDVTPPQGVVHQIEIEPAQVPAFLARIDPSAPAGKLAKIISPRVSDKGRIVLTITYLP